jgi:hypothetical protein
MRRDYLTLADLRTETLSIQCPQCGRFGRYNVAKLIEHYGDIKLPDLRHVLANCSKAQSQSIHEMPGPVRRRQPPLMIANPRLALLPAGSAEKGPPKRAFLLSVVLVPVRVGVAGRRRIRRLNFGAGGLLNVLDQLIKVFAGGEFAKIFDLLVKVIEAND